MQREANVAPPLPVVPPSGGDDAGGQWLEQRVAPPGSNQAAEGNNQNSHQAQQQQQQRSHRQGAQPQDDWNVNNENARPTTANTPAAAWGGENLRQQRNHPTPQSEQQQQQQQRLTPATAVLTDRQRQQQPSPGRASDENREQGASRNTAPTPDVGWGGVEGEEGGEGWRRRLGIGSKLDVEDTVRRWCEASVVGVDEAEAAVFVTYTYWAPKVGATQQQYDW